MASGPTYDKPASRSSAPASAPQRTDGTGADPSEDARGPGEAREPRDPGDSRAETSPPSSDTSASPDSRAPHEEAHGKRPAYYARRKKRGNELCQILIRSGDVKPEHVRQALRIQEERGGQIGRILVKMGVCSERAVARALAKQVQLAHAAGKERNLSLLARQHPTIAGLEVTCSPTATTAALFASDLVVVAVIGAIAAAADRVVAGHLSASLFQYGFAALVLCLLVLATMGAYAPTAASPPDEIRTTTLSISLVFLSEALVAMFGWQSIPWHVHAILFFEWTFCVLLLPIVRAIVRVKLSRRAWWGVPVVVLGAGKTGRTLVRALQARPHVGLRPVLILDDDAKKHGTLRASLADGNEIEVNSIRDVPVQSIARVDAVSAEIAALARSGGGSSRDVSAAARGSTRDAAPHTIRSPSTNPPKPLETTQTSAFSSWPPKQGEPTISSIPPRNDASPSAPPPPKTISSNPPPSEPERSSTFPAVPPSEFPPAMPPLGSDPAAWSPSDPLPPTPRVSPPPPPLSATALPPLTAAAFQPSLSRDKPSTKEPSWLHQVPESIKGIVRGQFSEVERVPVIGGLELAPLLSQRLKISYAIVAMPGQTSRRLLQLTEKIGGAFSHLLVIPDLIGFASIGVPAREVGGVLGVEVRQQLLLPGPRAAKRFMDVALTLLGGIFVLPIILLLALLIKVDSKGPVLYPQKRLGRDGKPFTAMKFRTMHGDGEERLKAVLDANPQMKAEYEEFHKLAFDPRVTRIGRILRKYSLDELPQLWNVVRGDMSLVGPRPYLEREIAEMENKEGIILRAMPGMTGLWQVSDRNATGFAERLKMDVHYVRNWSPWLDLYVLARTFGVVLKGTGS